MTLSLAAAAEWFNGFASAVLFLVLVVAVLIFIAGWVMLLIWAVRLVYRVFQFLGPKP